MVNDDQIKRDVRAILAGIVEGNDASTLADEDDIRDTGLDSVGTLMLITEIENKYTITLTADAIPYDKLTTIAGIAEFVRTRLQETR